MGRRDKSRLYHFFVLLGIDSILPLPNSPFHPISTSPVDPEDRHPHPCTASPLL